MKQTTPFFLSVILLMSASLSASSEYSDGAISERIYFIQEDGRHALVYTTSRSDFSTYSLWFTKRKGYTAENYLEDFYYLYPSSENWIAEEDAKYMALKLPYGDFASLKWVNLEEKGRLQVDKDGVYYFRNWNEEKEERTAEGHYGIWNSPSDFKQIACSWVFPKNLEPVTYLANQKGEWKQRHNTLTYYGQNVNDLFFAIQYRPTSGDAYNELKGLEGEGIEVEQQPTGVKMTLAETLLFPSGVARISSAGTKLLNRLAESLKQQTALNIVVAGHTDNVPIGVELKKRFPSNWELSSKRAINIIHYLVAQGIDEARFEAQAFSFMRPRSSNEDEDGRSKNRRIEIMLTDTRQNPSTTQARLGDANAY
jgi:chemotaxis protein MotB